MAEKKTVQNDTLDKKEFFAALAAMEAERGIPKEFIAEKIADAITVAARKDFGGNDIVTCVIDTEKEVFDVFARKQIVDEVTDVYTQISAEEAKAIDPASLEQGYVDIKIEPKKFGRVVAQNSKNNFRQGVRDAERGQVLAEFQAHNREIVTALVEKIDPKTGNAIIKIGKDNSETQRKNGCDNLHQRDVFESHLLLLDGPMLAAQGRE